MANSNKTKKESCNNKPNYAIVLINSLINLCTAFVRITDHWLWYIIV